MGWTPEPYLIGNLHKNEVIVLAGLAVAIVIGLASGKPTGSLWTRMGEEKVIRPMCNDLYDLHASDPLTKDWFPPSSSWNQRTAAEVKENVFTFFSSGIGGPHEYKGQDMVAAHEKMAKQMPITEAAFHALTCAPAAAFSVLMTAHP